MLEQLIALDHVIVMRLSGILTLEDVKQYQRLLEDKLGTHTHINVCIDLTGLFDMKANALFGGLKVDMEWLTQFDQIDRFALVSEKEWPQAVIDISAPVLLPGMEVKVFKPDDRKEALEWVAEHSSTPQIEPSVFCFLTNSKEQLLGIKDEQEYRDPKSESCYPQMIVFSIDREDTDVSTACL